MEESAHAQDEGTQVNVSTGSASPASAAGPGPDTAVVAVELRSVSKRYGTLAANDDISLTVRSGEIHVLVGENGAGKSTLMGILSGTVKPDAGQVLIRGEDVTGYSPRAAIVKGIGMVHQHFRLAGAFTVAQNIVLGFEPRGRFGLFDTAASRASCAGFGDPPAAAERGSLGRARPPQPARGLAPPGLPRRLRPPGNGELMSTITVAPGDVAAEQLWRALMRAEHAAGNLSGVREAWSRCLDTMADIAADGEPHPETAELYQQLVSGASPQPAWARSYR